MQQKLTVKTFHKVLSVRDATSFISQLKIFTPIEVRLLVESITPPSSNVIDVELLSKKIRDSYLSGPDISKAHFLMSGELTREQALRETLRQSLDQEEVVKVLRANSGKISKGTF